MLFCRKFPLLLLLLSMLLELSPLVLRAVTNSQLDEKEIKRAEDLGFEVFKNLQSKKTFTDQGFKATGKQSQTRKLASQTH